MLYTCCRRSRSCGSANLRNEQDSLVGVPSLSHLQKILSRPFSESGLDAEGVAIKLLLQEGAKLKAIAELSGVAAASMCFESASPIFPAFV